MRANESHCGTFEPTFPLNLIQVVFLSVIFVLSLVGNTLIIIVVYKRPELRKTVNHFIVNMAVSDFVFPLTFIPASLGETTAGSWEWLGFTAGSTLCKIRNFLTAVSLTVSIESLVWIAFDRFFAVIWPMKVHLISPRFHAFAIASTWILAVLFNSLDLYYSNLIKLNVRIVCYTDTNSFIFKVYGYIKLAVIYIAPMILLTILYSAIAVTLRREDRILQSSTAKRTDHKKRQAIKMSLCIIILFYLFFLPFTMAMIIWRTPLQKKWCSFYYHFYLFSSFSVFISSTTNPIICFTFIESYRRGLRDVLNFSLCKRFGRTTIKTTAGGREEIILKRITCSKGIEKNI